MTGRVSKRERQTSARSATMKRVDGNWWSLLSTTITLDGIDFQVHLDFHSPRSWKLTTSGTLKFSYILFSNKKTKKLFNSRRNSTLNFYFLQQDTIFFNRKHVRRRRNFHTLLHVCKHQRPREKWDEWPRPEQGEPDIVVLRLDRPDSLQVVYQEIRGRFHGNPWWFQLQMSSRHEFTGST